MRAATPKRTKRQGTPTRHVILGTLVIVLLLIVSALAKSAYKEQPVAPPAPAPAVKHKAPAHQPVAPPEEPDQPPLRGGTM